ncbi:MAG: ATP-binding protein [Elusimicrobia bacterium]|nr:ATP-binding protein [Elusimicrobiota bacterium]
MIRRTLLPLLEEAFRAHPAVALLGPRQCGKTTLARMFAKRPDRGPVSFFDLEDPVDLERLRSPKSVLEPLKGLVVIDEVQRAPDLFPVLRVLIDRPLPRKIRPRFLLLGSASPDLLRQGSESLAGRLRYVELTPFRLAEVGDAKLRRLWSRGGFPRSFLARGEAESLQWRQAFISAYLERDIPALGLHIPPAALRRFWLMLAHYHGQVFNASEIGRSLGTSDTTVRRYLDILSGTYMIRQLAPWAENIAKRQVKAPKIYFRDSGILHALLGVRDERELPHHPKMGASWEGFALEEIIRSSGATAEEVYFWATHSAAELDLLIVKDGKRRGYEIKFADVPRPTKSMRIALADLRLDSLTIVYPGDKSFRLDKRIDALGLSQLNS